MSRRSAIVAIGAAAALLGGGMIAGRADRANDADYAAYCTDEQQRRVDDSECRNGRPGANWYYLNSGSRGFIPPIGQQASGGSHLAPPASANVVRGASPSGDTVSRGGFGSHQSSSVGG